MPPACGVPPLTKEHPINLKPNTVHNIWRNASLPPAAKAILATTKECGQASIRSFFSITTGKLERVILNTPNVHDEIVEAIAKKVGESEHSLLLQTYILIADSEAAKDLFTAVGRKQSTNPHFKCVIIFNALASSTRELLLEEAKACGAGITFVPYAQGWSRRSLHSKIAIHDGKTAIIGGSNVDNPPETDLAVELSGTVVKGFVTEFSSLLNEITTRPTSAVFSSGAMLFTSKDPTGNALFHGMPIPETAHDESPMIILSKEGVHWRGPFYRQQSNLAILKSINAATEEICIRSPNVNDIALLSALTSAARRGVSVKILLPKGYLKWVSFIDSAGNYAPLIFKAQKLPRELHDKFTIRWYSDDGTSLGRSHAKLFLIDGIPILGSQNADNQSFCFSRELSIALLSPISAKTIRERAFDPYWEKGIPVPMTFIHRILPTPASSWQRRIGRCLRMPELIIKNIVKNFREHCIDRRSQKS
jgi:phosphatidylserine/phosphatidylglycerophosphate/cardiolipin synthase-like enzyme